MDNQKEILEKVLELIDSDFAKLGKASLMTGIECKKLIALRDQDKKLNETDFNKLKRTLKDFKEFYEK